MNLDQQLHVTAFEGNSRRKDKMTKRTENGFNDLGIAPNLLKGISRLNFKDPTPIQKESIPVGLNGDDIIALAKTGSGKTIAYGIPMLQRLSKLKRCTGLVLVPTRELAIQVDDSLRSFCSLANIRSVVLIGGASMFVQRNALKKNPRIIIATPGRLMDHISRKTVNLSSTEVFILDEADRMLDMGFVPDIKKIMKSLPDRLQTMLFSATMPKEIEAIAEEIMENPTRVEVDHSGTTPAEISHEMFLIKNQDKSRLLALHLKKCTGPVLVFTRTKRMASKLKTKVNKMGFNAAEIHSDRSLAQRRHALEGFKRGVHKILIATDIAARGIDVTGIELVVNYDMPANSEDYVHRIGRTGRAGKTGHAISFANTSQKSYIRSIERFMKTKMAISALPTLPSEKVLLREAGQLNSRSKPLRDETQLERKSFGDSQPKRKNFRRTGPNNFSKRRNESKQRDYKRRDLDQQELKSRDFNKKKSDHQDTKPRDYKRKESDHQDTKPRDFNRKKSDHQDTKPRDYKRKESDHQDSKHKDSKPKKSQSVKTKDESSFWLNFKKHRPTKKKKSVGQGSRRKRRSKRK